MIRSKGFGWEEAGHAWSKNGQVFTSQELMKHFIEKVLPMEDERGVPNEPPMKLQSVSEKYTLGILLQILLSSIQILTQIV
jgi:hypothetical protein